MHIEGAALPAAASALLLSLKSECEAQHARAEKAETEREIARQQLEALRAALRDLVERWRGDADLSSLRWRAEIFRRCANDVDAALALHGGKE